MKAVSDRPIRAGEETAVLDLWAASLPVDRRRLQHEYRADPLRGEHTFVAASAEGTIVSAVTYCLRRLRDAHGEPQLVGGVSAVATRPDSRGQGHARRLLDLAVESMRREGCAWALLFTEVNGYYERLGWQTVETRYREGRLAAERSSAPADYCVERFDPTREAEGWEALARVYDAYNAKRPLSLVRTLPYWQSYLLPRFTAATALLFVARRGAGDRRVVGYLLAHLLDSAFAVTEAAALPEAPGAVSSFVAALAEAAAARGIGAGRVYLPLETEVDAALARVFAGTAIGWHRAMMVRPVEPGLDPEQILATFRAPGAIYWPSDDF